MTELKLQRRIAGTIGLLAVLSVMALLVAFYLKAFTSTVDVTVMTERAGLLLERGASVRLYGVPVGEVRDRHITDEGRVAISVALDPKLVNRIPADVTASIDATTVFGAKFVNLDVPRDGGSARIATGDVVHTDYVSTEVNDTFQHAMNVLTAVDAVDLNNTLSQTALALNGRGAKLGQYLTQVHAYLDVLNDHVPQLSADLARSRSVLDTYADVAPDVIEVATNASTTAVTLHKNVDTLDTLLADMIGTSARVSSFLDVVEEPLLRTIKELTPVTDLLRVYSPEVGCLIDGLTANAEASYKVLGARDPGFQQNVGLLPPQAGYDPDKNLPKLVTGVGPVCYPRIDLDTVKLPHVRFDDGTQDVYDGVGPVSNPGTLHNPFPDQPGVDRQ